MQWRGRGLGVFGAAAIMLSLVACGGGSREAHDTEPVKAIGLDEALSATAAASGHRISQSTGQVLSVAPLGLDSRTELDEDHPSVVTEATGDLSHLRVDLSSVFGPLLGDNPPSIGFDIWVSPDRMVVDSTDYAAILDINPNAELGPMAPGVAFVDLDAVRDDAPDLVAALVGQGIPDLQELADRLPRALDDVEQRGTTFTGTASYTDLLTAMGTDPEVVARSAAAGVALNLDVDPDELTAFYVDYYEGTEADVTVEVGDEGVRSLHYELDLSGLFPAIIEHSEELGIAIPDDQLTDAREAFADTVWTLEALIRFERVDDLKVEPAPDTTDDRTQQWLAFLADGGF